MILLLAAQNGRIAGAIAALGALQKLSRPARAKYQNVCVDHQWFRSAAALALALMASLSLLSKAHAEITYVGAGSEVGAKTSASPAWPSHVTGDIALLLVETKGDSGPKLSTAADFVELPSSPQAVGANTKSTGTMLSVYWARATSSSMSKPTVTVAKNKHVYARIIVYRGVIAKGDPWDVTDGGRQYSLYHASSNFDGPGTSGCVGTSSGASSCTLQTTAKHGFDGVDLNANTGFRWTNIEGLGGGEAEVYIRVSASSGTRSMGLYLDGSSTGDTVTTSSTSGPRPGGELTGPYILDLDAGKTHTVELRDNKSTDEHDVHYMEVETTVDSITIPSITTKASGTMIVQIVARNTDDKASAYSSQSNANLKGLTERVDSGTKKSDGGGIAAWDGLMGDAGEIGETSAKVEPSYNAFITLSLMPDETPAVSYYRISHSGTGITCAAEPITISAYDSSDSLVIPPAGTTITVSTSPATGTWTSNTYEFTGSESSTILYLRQTSAATLNIQVTDGSAVESPSYDPSITFVDSAVKFYGSSALIALPNQVAGVADNALILKAIRTDSSTGACVAQVTGTRTVGFGYECRNPISCVAGQTLTLNGNSVQSNASGAVISYTNQSLSFNASGEASIPFSYTDVGQIRLHARLALAASGNDPAITLNGTSSEFVVKPYTLAISAVTTAADVANPGGTSAAGAGAGFVAAGTAFKVKVEARNFAGNRTPNFGNETVPEHNQMRLAEVALAYPAGGTLTPISGAAANSFSATTPAGTFINSSVVWNQVGSLTLRPELADSTYLGAGNLITHTTSGTIGRFYPDHFFLSAANNSAGCGTFTYIGQPNISLFYQVLARTAGGTTLTNYGGNYGGASQATPTYVAEEADGGDGASLSSRVSAGSTPTWANGVLALSSTTASFARESTNAAPDGPYASLQLGLQLTDSFDNRALQTLNMNANTTGACAGGTCTAATLGSPLILRYGRARLSDSFGPETANLPVELVTEYWTGGQFIQNISDSCTVIPRASITYPDGNLSADGNRTVNLTGGTTQGIYANLDLTGVNFSGGSAGHYFSKPTTNGKGAFTVSIDLTNLSWLRYDWNQDGNFANTSIPTAQITFGAYRGHDRILYWRERLE